MGKLKRILAKIIIKLSPLRWAEKQVQVQVNFDAQLIAHQETIYAVMKSAMADRGER